MAARVVKMPSRKEAKDAAEALSEAKPEYLECRDLRHPWKVLGLFYVGKEIHRSLECMRCGTTATDKWSAKGERLARTYHYAAGYEAKGVRIRPVDVRRAVLGRVTVYGSEDEMRSAVVLGRRKQA